MTSPLPHIFITEILPWKIESKIYENETGNAWQKDLINLYEPTRSHKPLLTYLFPMHSFSSPWKHQKTLMFSGGGEGEKEYIGDK